MDRALEVVGGKLDIEVGTAEEEHDLAQAERPEVVAYRLAYASAESLRPALGLVASPPSDLEIDERTNTLIVRAVPSVQERVAELVASLDISVEVPKAPRARARDIADFQTEACLAVGDEIAFGLDCAKGQDAAG